MNVATTKAAANNCGAGGAGGGAGAGLQ